MKELLESNGYEYKGTTKPYVFYGNGENLIGVCIVCRSLQINGVKERIKSGFISRLKEYLQLTEVK